MDKKACSPLPANLPQKYARLKNRKRFRRPNSQVYIEVLNFQNILTIDSLEESSQQMIFRAIVVARLE